MLSTIGRGALQRVCVGGNQSSGRVGWQLLRICNVADQSHVPSSNCSLIPQFTIHLKRSYATATKAKPAAGTRTRRATTTKSTTKKPAKKAAKPKGRPKKKVAVKAKPKGKVLTEKQKTDRATAKTKAHIKELKATALLDSPKLLPQTAWQVMLQETFKDKKTELAKDGIGALASQAAVNYKALDASSREHYNHLANQNKQENEVAYKKWVESHTPDQIRAANVARASLKRNGKAGGKIVPRSSKYSAIQDSRLPKRPRAPRIIFQMERFQSGDMKGIPFTDGVAAITKQWTELSDSERKHFQDVADDERRLYAQEYKTVYHRDLPVRKSAAAA